jgi:anti-sigma factor RsiW
MTGEQATHPSPEQLQRGYDGDITSQQAAELQRHLAICAQCQADYDAFGRLGQLLRWAAQEPVPARAEPDFKSMFAAISRAVALPAPAPVAEIRTLPMRRPTRWWSRPAPALGAVALAAAAALLVLRQDNVLPNDAHVGDDGHSYETVAQTGTEVVSYDFGTNAGQVFDIPMSDGPAVPVVWIDDDEDDED